MERVMATAIDTQVLNTQHKYPTVDRSTVPYTRNVSDVLGANTFEPVFQRNALDPETKSLNLQNICGTEASSWYSPSAITMYNTPYAFR